MILLLSASWSVEPRLVAFVKDSVAISEPLSGPLSDSPEDLGSSVVDAAFLLERFGERLPRLPPSSLGLGEDADEVEEALSTGGTTDESCNLSAGSLTATPSSFSPSRSNPGWSMVEVSLST